MNGEISSTPPGRSERVARRLSPWLLGLAVIVFVLPFVSVSCSTPRGYGSAGGGYTARYSGLTLAFGGNPTVEAADRAPAPGPLTPEDTIPGQIAVTIALAVTIAAFAVSLVRPAQVVARVAMPIVAAAGLVIGVTGFDRWLTARIVDRMATLGVPQQQGFPPERYVTGDGGFGVAVALLVVTALLNAFAFLRRRRSR
jgi:hypothetical protein